MTFEELNDPTPPHFDTSFRRSVGSKVTAKRRRKTALYSVVAALALGVGGLYAKAASQISRIERIHVAGLSPAGSQEPVTVLLVGLDQPMSAANQPAGPLADARADAMVLVRLDPQRADVRMLSIPRDLDVSEKDPAVASHDQIATRLNTRLATGGPGSLASGVESLGLKVNHIVMVDYTGFESLVDAVGGITLDIKMPVRDRMSGLDQSQVGCRRLDGTQALALARSRHLEWLEGATWVRDPSGDFGRTDRQRMMLVAAIAQLKRQVPDPFAADRLSSWALEHVRVDAELTRERLTEIVDALAKLDDSVDSSRRLPTVDATGPNGEALLRPSDALGETVSWFRGEEDQGTQPGSAESGSAKQDGIPIAPC